MDIDERNRGSGDPRSIETPEGRAFAELASRIAPALGDAILVIRGQAGRVLDSADLASDVRESLHEIHSSAERAAAVAAQLLHCGGCHPLHPEVVDLNRMIEAAQPSLRLSLGTRIELEFHAAGHLPAVVVDASVLEEALLFVAANARDAMPEGGRFTITTTTITIRDYDLAAFPDGRPGNFVVATLADTGTGIPAEVLPHIFEPFYTTRDAKQHVGLGLAAVLGIVRQHRGWVTVESRAGKGSRFSLFLPSAAAGSKPTPARKQSGGETVLVVDDDALVREFTVATLARKGYRALQAADGEEALTVWRWHKADIALLITDIVLPGTLGGQDLARRMAGEKQDLAVVLCSGYGPQILAPWPDRPRRFQFLQKPWRSETLLRLVGRMLEPPVA